MESKTKKVVIIIIILLTVAGVVLGLVFGLKDKGKSKGGVVPSPYPPGPDPSPPSPGPTPTLTPRPTIAPDCGHGTPSSTGCTCDYGWVSSNPGGGTRCDKRQIKSIVRIGSPTGSRFTPYSAESACVGIGGTTATYQQLRNDTTGFFSNPATKNWCGQAQYVGDGRIPWEQGCFDTNYWPATSGTESPAQAGLTSDPGASPGFEDGFPNCCANQYPNCSPCVKGPCTEPSNMTQCGCGCDEGVFCIINQDNS